MQREEKVLETNELENGFVRLETEMKYVKEDVSEVKCELRQLSKEIHNGLISKKVHEALEKLVGKIVLRSLIGSGALTAALVWILTNFGN